MGIRTERFQAFSDQHYLLLALAVCGAVVVVWAGRRHRGAPRELVVRRTAATLLAAVGIAMQAYQFTPTDFDLRTSLPIQLCDLATVAAVVALWTRRPAWAAFTYYVGLSLTLQGVLTPSLAEAFPHPRYFGFWALHLGVVWTAVYLTWGLGMRPTWRLWRTSVVATLVWAVVPFAFNLAAGTNYGYLNRKPASASVLDLLPGWPTYVLIEIAVLLVVWAGVMTWPWVRLERRRVSAAAPGVRARAG